MEKNQKLLKWLENEQLKDKNELDIEKRNLINQLKRLKKEDVLPEKPKNLTLWQRIKKVLMG
jgi:hypothetical protein